MTVHLYCLLACSIRRYGRRRRATAVEGMNEEDVTRGPNSEAQAVCPQRKAEDACSDYTYVNSKTDITYRETGLQPLIVG